MDRISVSQMSSSRWSFFLDVIRYNSFGFNSIGIWRPKLEECDLEEAAEYLHEMKTEVSSVHWAGGFTGGCGLSFEESIQDAYDAIELTSRLNGDCLIIHPGCRNGHTSSHAQRLLSKALKTLVPIAADYDVRLALELMPCPEGSQWTFLQSLNRTLDFADRFPAQHLGFVLDLFHVGLNPDVFEVLHDIIERICLVQLADRGSLSSSSENRMILGSGEVLFGKWIEKLAELGYRGWYELELHGESLRDIPYSQRILQSKEFLLSMDSPLDDRYIGIETRLPRRSKPDR